MVYNVSRYCLLLLFLSLVMYSCGLREAEKSDSDFAEDATVPVAQFQDMRMPVPMGWFRHYTFNEDWFYVTSSEYDMEIQQVRWYVADIFGSISKSALNAKFLLAFPGAVWYH